MLWSHLPLIEMDDYGRNNAVRPKEAKRPQDRDPGAHLEIDIGRQLSELREQSGTSRDNSEPKKDQFGRDVSSEPSALGNEKEVEKKTEDRDREKLNRMEGNHSPREWRRGREAEMDRGFGDRVRDRSRDRDRDWGRDEPRRRPRDYDGHGEFSDGSEGSFEGDRERNRDRRRDRDPDRYRERRDRDREYRDRDEREWRRDRWEDRDDRRRDYRDSRDRRHDEDGQWSDYRSRDRYHEDRDFHHREPRLEEPSEVVILKGLPSSIEDNQIHALLSDAKLPYKDVRVVKNRQGSSRGFCFVEFLDVDTAKGWIESSKGKLEVDNCSVMMDFSRSKSVMEVHKDWICSKCGTQNFSSKRRNVCFSCNAPKDENDEQKDIGQTPCKVLILRGLDTLTTEETIRNVLSAFTSLPIFDVRLIKDKMTNTSRGFCFIELGSIEEATKLLEEIQSASFKIDEKPVTVSYARFGTHPPKPSNLAGGSSSGVPSTGAHNEPSGSSSSSTNQTWPKNHFAANAIAQAHAAAKMGNTSDPTSPGAQITTPAVAPAPVPGYPQDPSLPSTVLPQLAAPVPAPTAGPQEPGVLPGPAVAPPALSSYVYDATSGYYYDTTTGLYYDPTTQYYFNSTTQQYMYWDAPTQQYVAVVSSNPVPVVPVDSNDAEEPSEVEGQAGNKDKQKKAKGLTAKKIAKDMERWAKKMNVNKDVARPQAAQSTQEASKESSTYQYDPNELKKTGIKMSLVGSSSISSLSALTSSSPLAALSEIEDTQNGACTATGSLVAEYGDDEDSGGEENKAADDTFTDWTKVACLLCKRQFPTKEALTRHNQFSELHKQNLQVQKKLKMSFTEIDDYEREQREAKYRDRAKERRELFGQPDSTPVGPPNKKKRPKHGKASYEQPTKDGITSDNIGNKMLQAMGWTQGTGLGKDRQGIVDPIAAKMRNRSAGLGLSGSDFGATAGDSERDMLKKMAQSRYDSLE